MVDPTPPTELPQEVRAYATRVDRFLAPYVNEPGLLPVTLVLMAHLVLAVAVSVLDAWRSMAGFAVLALVIMGTVSLTAWFFDWRHGRVGIVGGAWLLSWPLGLACAWFAARWELY